MTAPRQAARPVRWRYHFTDLRLGRLLATLPLTGVKLTEVLNGPSAAEGVVPLAEPVRARDPFTATVPRRSCLWAERQELDPATGRTADSRIMWSGIVMARTRQHAARTMKLTAVSWEAYLARRLLHRDLRYTQADKFTIMRELLLEGFAQYGADDRDLPPQYPDFPPHWEPLSAVTGALSGVRADRTYLASDLKPVLEACKELAASGSGFDWRLVGYMQTPGDLDTLRVRAELGSPRLGRVAPPDLRWSTEQRDARQRWGFVQDLTVSEDGSGANNRVVALGEGSGPDQLRAVASSWPEYESGYPIYESSLQSSTQDLRTLDAVQGHAWGALASQLASKERLSGVQVRGDLNPTVTMYAVGDDATVRIGSTTTGTPTTVVGQIIGRTIQPAERGSTEQVTFDLQGAGG